MNKSILLIVTGSISAYKSADISSRLVSLGYDVHVVMTDSGAKFISPMVFETLTRNKVYVDMFKDEDHTHVTHISHATEKDLILVAPATFNIIGKAACGIADDLASSILAAADPEKVIFAPAMNVNMYNNPACIKNIDTLTQRGCAFIEPEEGMLACQVVGKGRLRNVPSIIEHVEAFFCEKILSGKKVTITAGATREYIDPIRFFSNTSSGLMGSAIAKACRNMGADVVLIIANSRYEPEGVRVVKTDTVKDMYEAVLEEFYDTDIFFSVAAVSDYRPEEYSSTKIKKSDEKFNINFVKNTDILFEMGKLKKDQLMVGFAAESENLLENARIKLSKKNLDVIVANDLSNFSSNDGRVVVITKDSACELDIKAKEELAYDIVRKVLELI